MSWPLKEKLKKQLAAEQGAVIHAPGSRPGFALAFPNTYQVGMSNLGFHIIYREINASGLAACERVFLPGKKDLAEHHRTNTPLMTLETQRPLYEFPLVGFAVSFEIDYFNLLAMLDLGKIPLLAADRGEEHPIVLAGGPCATFNPEPLAAFIDAFVIGEGEEVIREILAAWQRGREEGLAREDMLLSFAAIPGVYVPAFYKDEYNPDGTLAALTPAAAVPAVISRRWVRDLDAHPGQTAVVTADTEFGDMYLIEIARGCGRHCRFCMAGYCFRRPRARSLAGLEETIRRAEQYRDKIGLVGAAVSDHPDIDRLVAFIRAQGLKFSVASIRADSFTPALAEALAASGHKTITLAPEAASDRLRRIINKGIDAADLERAVALAAAAGIPNVRLYIMVGLPGEQDDDIAAIAELARATRRHMAAHGSGGRLTLSINPFIPKPFTPFQWLPMAPRPVVEDRLAAIRAALKADKNTEILVEPPKEAYLQGVLSRGDRRLGPVLLAAHRAGGPKHWPKALAAAGLDETFYLYRERPAGETLPWHHLDMGLEPGYLRQELDRARAEKYTPPCQPGCTRCGVCRPSQGEGGGNTP
ncbi:TIGR03960 family B12-binding radical SAM protein [Anaeroselena agilis]|uniref:TIGR03960 family B12-binding radical SAM protein n=1 Tax=Anaeroselena agilis TaxID=3063788 RepID=A0ABU3NXT1_9FIRM|nr:TIGR03960 family B12-binding radical SAM protein [Selenomonadales bacterium 4137-cl]